MNARNEIIEMFGKKAAPEKSFWELHGDVQTFVATIEEAVQKGEKELANIETTIKEAEAQKSAIKTASNWLSEVRKVFPASKKS